MKDTSVSNLRMSAVFKISSYLFQSKTIGFKNSFTDLEGLRLIFADTSV